LLSDYFDGTRFNPGEGSTDGGPRRAAVPRQASIFVKRAEQIIRISSKLVESRQSAFGRPTGDCVEEVGVWRGDNRRLVCAESR
jgi:hypothetical protein